MRIFGEQMMVFAFLFVACLVTGKPMTKTDLVTYALGWVIGSLINLRLERRRAAARQRNEWRARSERYAAHHTN